MAGVPVFLEKNKTMVNILEEIKSDDDFIVDLMYCGTKNMLLQDIYGKVGLGNRCFVRPEMKEILEKVRKELRKRQLKLKIKDGYRPPRAHELMLEIIPMVGFFARSPELSQHCHGSAIDVILCDDAGKELRFPCNVDGYEEHFAKEIKRGEWAAFREHLERGKYTWFSEAEKESIDNRNLQRAILEDSGLKALEHEWWHFNMPNKELYDMVEFDPTGKNIFYCKNNP